MDYFIPLFFQWILEDRFYPCSGSDSEECSTSNPSSSSTSSLLSSSSVGGSNIINIGLTPIGPGYVRTWEHISSHYILSYHRISYYEIFYYNQIWFIFDLHVDENRVIAMKMQLGDMTLFYSVHKLNDHYIRFNAIIFQKNIGFIFRSRARYRQTTNPTYVPLYFFYYWKFDCNFPTCICISEMNINIPSFNINTSIFYKT